MELLVPNHLLLVWTLLSLLLLVTWAVALIDIFRSNFREPNDKLVWTVMVLLLPFIGTILYFSIGRKRKPKLNRY